MEPTKDLMPVRDLIKPDTQPKSPSNTATPMSSSARDIPRPIYHPPPPTKRVVTIDEINLNQKYREQSGYAANPFCTICNGAGWIHPLKFDGKPDYGAIIPCTGKDCLVESKKHRLQTGRSLVLHGVTERMQTFESFWKISGTEKAFAAFYSLAYGNTEKTFILCYGGTGNGKTHLCQSLLKVLITKGIEAYYYQVANLLNHLRQAIENNGSDEWVDALCRVPALILDDFGSESYSEWGISKIQEIIDTRWTDKRITVMTMNKDITDLQTTSPRLFSRMCDQDISVVVRNDGKDYRIERRFNNG
jgi:DNA replication protein DnaC